MRQSELIRERELAGKQDPEWMWALRMKFLEQAKQYFGVPYAKRYHTPGSESWAYFLFINFSVSVPTPPPKKKKKKKKKKINSIVPLFHGVDFQFFHTISSDSICSFFLTLFALVFLTLFAFFFPFLPFWCISFSFFFFFLVS